MAITQDQLVGEAFDFEATYRTYAARVRRLIRRRVNDQGLAEDLTQETFLRAYRAGPRLDPARPIWPWLATVAQNVATDALRSRRPERLGHGDDVAALPSIPSVSSLTDPESALLATERRIGIRSAFGGMTPRQQRVLVRQAIDHWPYERIAAAEDISVVALKPLVARARRTFRRLYAVEAEARGLSPVVLFAGLSNRLRRLGGGARDASDLVARTAGWAPVAAQLAAGAVFATTMLVGAPATAATGLRPEAPAPAASAVTPVVVAGPAPATAPADPGTATPPQVAPAPSRRLVAQPSRVDPAVPREPSAPRPTVVADTGAKIDAHGDGWARADVSTDRVSHRHWTGVDIECSGSVVRSATCDAASLLEPAQGVGSQTHH